MLLALLLAAVLEFFYGKSEVSPGRIFITVILVFSFSFLVFLFFISGPYGKAKKLLAEVRHMRAQPGTSHSGDPMEDLGREVKEFSEERKEETERLKKLETYRKEFLGNVSHELKTPIFNIQGYISTLLDGGLEDPKINRDYLQRAERSVDRMIAIIEDLQAITQLETGELELDEERFDILALAKDVVDAQDLKAREQGVTLELINDTSVPIYVYADRFRIRQVLVNLVVNSVRYGKKGGQSTIRISDAGNKVIVEVADNGIGIAKEHLPRIFERFYRVDKSRSREMGGTGLGLSIVKHIIEAHNQSIDVMSTVGAGSVFSFTLKKA